MVGRRLFTTTAILLLLSVPGRAQIPLTPAGPLPPATIGSPQRLAPLPPAPPAPPSPPSAPMPAEAPTAPEPAAPAMMPGTATPPPAAAAPAAPSIGRVFCAQQVNFSLAPGDGVPEQYRPFIGIFSDAAWAPQLCAALVVENVTADGTATIVYAFGPMDSTVHGGGVLNGTGIIRDGELKFQNSDGSQYSFKPFYSDLEGHLLTPQGQAFEAIFKRTF